MFGCASFHLLSIAVDALRPQRLHTNFSIARHSQFTRCGYQSSLQHRCNLMPTRPRDPRDAINETAHVHTTSTTGKLQLCPHRRWSSPCSHSLVVVRLECCLQSCSARVQGCAIEHARAYCSSIAYNRIVQTRARQPAPALSNVNMGQPTEPQSQLPLVTCFSALFQLTCSSFHRAPLLGRAPCCRKDMHRRWCQHDVEQTHLQSRTSGDVVRISVFYSMRSGL